MGANPTTFRRRVTSKGARTGRGEGDLGSIKVRMSEGGKMVLE